MVGTAKAALDERLQDLDTESRVEAGSPKKRPTDPDVLQVELERTIAMGFLAVVEAIDNARVSQVLVAAERPSVAELTR